MIEAETCLLEQRQQALQQLQGYFRYRIKSTRLTGGHLSGFVGWHHAGSAAGHVSISVSTDGDY